MHPDPMNTAEFDEIKLDAELDAALATKPQVAVPRDFAARLALRLPPERSVRSWSRRRKWMRSGGRHAGLGSAVILLLVMLAVVTVRDPRWMAGNGTIGMALTLLLLAEVAGIALWLAIPGRTR